MNSDLNFKNILKSIGKNSLIYGISTGLQPLGGFILLPLYSEYFEKSEFGIYALILLISTIFSTVFYLGINSAFIRSYYDYESKEDRVKVFNTSLFILFIGLILQIITCIFTAKFLSVSILKNESYKIILIISVITFGLSFINTGILNYLRVKEKAFNYSLVNAFTFVFNITFILYLFEFHSKSIESPIYSALCSQLITMFLLIFLNIKDINLFDINKEEFSILLRYGLPSSLASIAVMIGEWGDKLLINEFINKDKLGIFSMGFKIAMLYNVIIVTPFALVWSPLMIKMRELDNAAEVFSKVAYIYFAISLLFIFICYVTFEPILTFLGFHSKFSESIDYVPLLMTALLFGSLQNIYSAGIIFSRKPIILFYIYLTVGLINLVASYYALINFGILGILFIYILFKFFTSMTIYYFSSKHFSFKIFHFEYVILFFLFFFGISLYINYFSNKYSFTFLLVYLVFFVVCLLRKYLLNYIITLIKTFKYSK